MGKTRDEMVYDFMVSVSSSIEPKGDPDEYANFVKECAEALANNVLGLTTYKKSWVGLSEPDIEASFNYAEWEQKVSFDKEPHKWCRAFAESLEARLRLRND